MPRGGARLGAGRPKGQGKYTEQTKPVRIPKSMVEEVSPKYFKTGEQAEGAKAFLEKRKPNFKKFR